MDDDSDDGQEPNGLPADDSPADDGSADEQEATQEDPLTQEEKRQNSINLLNETHTFPCPVMIKVIGLNEEGFISNIVKVIRDELNLKFDPPIRTREAKNGAHISITMEPRFLNAEEVLEVYARISGVDGVVMVL